MEKRRLKPEEWAQVRRRWEGAAEEGFEWLAKEIGTAWGVAITRPAVRQMATKPGAEWVKGPPDSTPLEAKVSAPATAPAAKVSVKQAPKVSTPKTPPKTPEKAPEPAGQVAPVKLPIAGRVKNEETGLTAQREEFAVFLAKGMSQSEAYRQAFPNSVTWKPESVAVEASTLAANPNVIRRVQDLMAEAAAASGADVAMVLREYLMRLQADPRELTEVRVAPCRFCWGTGNLYQFTDGELQEARDKHEAKRQARIENEQPDIGPFNEKGGGGYQATGTPNHECPSCAGAGRPNVVLKDSRHYSAGALALFGGVKQTKEGIEVKVVDRTDALQQVARHVAFFEADQAPAASITINMGELDAIYAEAMEKSKAGRESVRGRMERIAARKLADGDVQDV